MKLLAEPAGRSLERTGNRTPRGMIAHDRTRLIGQLLLRFMFSCLAPFQQNSPAALPGAGKPALPDSPVFATISFGHHILEKERPAGVQREFHAFTKQV